MNTGIPGCHDTKNAEGPVLPSMWRLLSDRRSINFGRLMRITVWQDNTERNTFPFDYFIKSKLNFIAISDLYYWIFSFFKKLLTFFRNFILRYVGHEKRKG